MIFQPAMFVYRNSIYLATIWVKYIPRNTEKTSKERRVFQESEFICACFKRLKKKYGWFGFYKWWNSTLCLVFGTVQSASRYWNPFLKQTVKTKWDLWLVCWFLLIFWWLWILKNIRYQTTLPNMKLWAFLLRWKFTWQTATFFHASWSSAAEDGWRLCARVQDPSVFQDRQKRLGIWQRFQRASFLLMVFCWFFVFDTFLGHNEYQWLKPVDGLLLWALLTQLIGYGESPIFALRYLTSLSW